MSQDLCKAVRNQDIDMVTALLDRGDNINFKDETFCDRTPLHLAIMVNAINIAEILIARGADVNAISDCYTPLHLSVLGGNLELVKFLISSGADVNIHGGMGSVDTPLHAAAFTNHPRIVEELIASDANINAIDCSGVTPIQVAGRRGHQEIIDLLLAQGAIEDTFISVSLGNIQAVESYLKERGDPNAAIGRHFGYNLLYFAVANNQLDVAELLIQYDADVNRECDQGGYALIEAAEYGSVEMVQLLIDQGANIHVTTDYGCGALEAAAGNGHRDVVQLLLDNGISVEGGSHTWAKPIDRAAEKGYEEIVELLITHGADKNTKPTE